MYKHKPRCYDSLRDLSSIRGIVPTWLPLNKKESFKTLFFIVYFLWVIWVIQSNKIKMERGSSPLSILNEQKSVFLTDILIKIFYFLKFQLLILLLHLFIKIYFFLILYFSKFELAQFCITKSKLF